MAKLGAVAHRVLGALGRSASARSVVLAFHATPSAAALTRTLDVLGDVAGPFRRLDDVVDGADGCALTFDDGDRSIIDVTAPLLHREGIPATTYVIGGLVGTDTPFWWHEVERRAPHDAAALVPAMKRLPDAARLEQLDELRARTPDVDVSMPNLTPEELPELERLGVDVGNHSLTHPLLDRCPDDKVDHELTRTHELLTDWLGHAPTSIAYPNGNVDERVTAVADRLGYATGLLFDHRVVDRGVDDQLRVSRVRLDVGAPDEVVRSHASGLHPRLHHALGRP